MATQRIDGCPITPPTREDIERLSVGDLAPTLLGDMRKVVLIFARGTTAHGKAYVRYYTDSGRAGISGSMVEGEPVITLPADNRYKMTG